MRRGLSVAAIIIGGVGMLPLIPVLLLQTPLYAYVPEFVFFRIEHYRALAGVFFLLVAPCLLLAGLILLQPNDRRRWLVMIWAVGVCAVTAPFGIGLMLCIPVLICVLLPIMLRFRASGAASD
ncbi:hypothetical protein [Pseudoroseomonas cervicalis]|uniref:hypothetical protein n=1 Tax=Teichococcus cervicalis TaxID=204525 RepID=UPI00278A4C2E|nr:hypothetical protein [Pseudoroseomonas cervicalis]MDQ1078260.1 hypothetical protein [Pseudoroseomonas cervicalis]